MMMGLQRGGALRMIRYQIEISKPNGIKYYATLASDEAVYEHIFSITKNHEFSEEVSSWCDLSSVGEAYKEVFESSHEDLSFIVETVEI